MRHSPARNFRGKVQALKFTMDEATTDDFNNKNTIPEEGEMTFEFPDHIFPPVKVPFPGLPLSPLDKIKKLVDAYTKFVEQANSPTTLTQTQSDSVLLRQVSLKFNSNAAASSIDIDELFKWARQVTDFAESQPGLDAEVVAIAVDVIELVSEASKGETRFKSAAQYLVGVWTLLGMHSRGANSDKAIAKFKECIQNGFYRGFYRMGCEVSCTIL